jgi:hypothetical protein
MTLTSGTKLGPYEIQSPVGAGGMGEVYLATDTRLDRKVAIKVLASHLSSSPELKQRMEREARAISSLNHPHICHLYDIGSQDGIDYLVMEFLEGKTLGPTASQRCAATERGLQSRDCRGRSASRRASKWDCSSRPEAGEHHAGPAYELYGGSEEVSEPAPFSLIGGAFATERSGVRILVESRVTLT